MSSEHSTLEKSVEEILIDLMAEKVMSVGIQARQLANCKHPHRLDGVLAVLLRNKANTVMIWLT
jgi:hypothetical protein